MDLHQYVQDKLIKMGHKIENLFFYHKTMNNFQTKLVLFDVIFEIFF